MKKSVVSTRRMKRLGSSTAHKVTTTRDGEMRALCGINALNWYAANGGAYQNCAGCDYIEQQIKDGKVKGR